jgi:lipoprotein-anchoring transpeptidase ErfK/SrfK
MFADSNAVPGESYYYRVIGKNESGFSSPSKVVGPVTPHSRMAMDDLKDFSLTYSKTPNLRISSEAWPRLRQTEEDFFQVERIPGSGSGEIIYKADNIKWIEVFTFSDKKETVSIQYSKKDKCWEPLPEGTIIKKHRPGYPSQYSGNKNNPIDKYTYQIPSLPNETLFVKILTGNANHESSYPWIARVHIGYTGKLQTIK